MPAPPEAKAEGNDWQWDVEVPDEQMLEPPRVPQRVDRLSVLLAKCSPGFTGKLNQVPEVYWDLEVAEEDTCADSLPASVCPRSHARKLKSVDEEFQPPAAQPILKPYINCEESILVDKVADLMSKVSHLSAELDGTILPTPRSPPVLGRLSKSEGEPFEDASIPQLRRRFGEVPGLPSAEVQPGSKALLSAGLARKVPIYAALRGQFAEINRENKRHITQSDFLAFVEARCPVPADSEPLLRETAKRCFHQAAVRREGLRAEDWLHYGLLFGEGGSQLHRRLRLELASNPQFLSQVVDTFEAVDLRGTGHLRLPDIKANFLKCQELVTQVQLAAQNPGKTEELSYHDFVAYCLGYRRSTVQLNWYDVSRGYAKWVPGKLVGQEGQGLEGIWHTGVLAFGREYWFGGKVLASEPGKAPFPPGPLRCTTLGTTLHTREELEDWLRLDLVSRYTRENYDILSHNCNHFSDEVAGFLIQGCHIPDEARRQPEALMGTSTMNILRPILNGWLGGFEARGAYSAEIDDLTGEWRARLWPGDLCLYLPPGAKPKLAQVSHVDAFNCVCDISFFDWDSCEALRPGTDLACWDWRLRSRASVPLTSLRPHETGTPPSSRLPGPGLGALLRAGVRKIDPGIQSILRRKAVVYAHCSQGHTMQSSEGNWSVARLVFSAACGICKKGLGVERKLECTSCGFFLCSSCDRKGLFRGYYSLGSMAATTARQLLQEPGWIRYKARRYLAAAGQPGGPLSLDVWQGKLALRLYGDLGQDPPNKEELIHQFRRHADAGDGSCNLSLSEDQFCTLLSEMLATNSFMFHL